MAEEKPKDTNNNAENQKTASSSPKVEKLIEEITGLSVLELAELVEKLQDKLGVASIPVAAPAAAPTQPSENGESTSAQPTGGAQTSQTVVLANAGSNKIAVIKALREINPQLGLKEAKELAESAPKEVLTDAKPEEAQEAKKKLEEAGATVELK